MLLFAFNSMSEVKTIYIFFVYDFQDLEAVLGPFGAAPAPGIFFPGAGPAEKNCLDFFSNC